MGAGDIIAASALAGACALRELGAVTLRDRAIRVEDVVDPACPMLADPQVGAAIIALMPAPRTRLRLNRLSLAHLLRRRVPGLDINPTRGEENIVFVAPAVAAPASPPCYAAAAPLRAGEAIAMSDLAATSCAQDAERAAITYDRVYGRVRASRDVAAGDYIGPVSAPSVRQADSGDALTLTAIVGATRVERPVTAVQPASRGGALFVRDSDGHILSAPMARADGGSAP